MLTPDEKKALIIAGSVAAIGLAIWLTKQQSIIPPGASAIQPTADVGSGPGYTTYNVPPFNGTPNSLIYPAQAMNDNGNGCCSDGCSTSGGINTGNAPTSLTQLLNWYSNSGKGDISSALANMVKPFTAPPTTIIDQTNIPTANAGLF